MKAGMNMIMVTFALVVLYGCDSAIGQNAADACQAMEQAEADCVMEEGSSAGYTGTCSFGCADGVCPQTVSEYACAQEAYENADCSSSEGLEEARADEDACFGE